MRVFFLLLLAALLLPQDAPAVATQEDRVQLVKDSNAFALDLYGKLATHRDGNLFFSPESLSAALGMIYAGARGETAGEMAQALHFTFEPSRLHPAMGALIKDLNAEGTAGGYALAVANALWLQKGYAFREGYLKLVEDNYGAGLNTVDFRNAAEAVRTVINAWVAQHTQNKITNLLPQKPSRDSRLVLTNAVYFKSKWLTPFDRKETQQGDFFITAANIPRVSFMHRRGTVNYLDGGTFQAVEQPYTGKDLSMVIFLPNDATGLPALEQSLTAQALAGWLVQLQPQEEVDLKLPRFTMAALFDLSETLGQLGMRKAFDPMEADFSEMADFDHYSNNLYISAVLHKAYVDVDEEGTEAAAATAVEMQAAAAALKPPPKFFHADHPFIFLIRDNRSGLILFMGRVMDPSK